MGAPVTEKWQVEESNPESFVHLADKEGAPKCQVEFYAGAAVGKQIGSQFLLFWSSQAGGGEGP